MSSRLGSVVTALGLGVAVALSGCLTSDSDGNSWDADADGWFSLDDCDDGDPEVNPDALEGCDDDVDNDCDRDIDCEDRDCADTSPCVAVFTGRAAAAPPE